MSVGPPTTPADLAALVEEIWGSLVDVATEPLVPVTDVLDTVPLTDPWSGQVAIDGEWHGVVRVDVAPPLAEALAARMLGDELSGEPGVADLEDAVGELANVIGGNVKSLVPGDGVLSLPAAGRPLPTARGALVCRTDHRWAGHRLSVTVLADVQEETR